MIVEVVVDVSARYSSMLYGNLLHPQLHVTSPRLAPSTKYLPLILSLPPPSTDLPHLSQLKILYPGKACIATIVNQRLLRWLFPLSGGFAREFSPFHFLSLGLQV